MRRGTVITLLPVLAACTSSSPVARQPAGTDVSARQPALPARTVRTASNPILSDSTDYTSDPAPLVAGGKLYILTGRDTANPQVNDFKMPEWQMLETSGDPMAGQWTHSPQLLTRRGLQMGGTGPSVRRVDLSTSPIIRPTRRTADTFVARSRSTGSNGMMALGLRGSRKFSRPAGRRSISRRSRTSRRMLGSRGRTFQSLCGIGCAR